ncbi:hypothetical protein Tco_0939598 [Tanacetum coccineum]|uniref:Reverse transcriptase domain-containing protein n=1 Tax=Tanacetum coccineum TaxID=301880 RepID=A0ABQ5DN35_9ASTR
MANLDFCVKHNMVAYLQKSEGSEGFQQIIDFLTTSHIRYSLTESPTIYVSLIEQFWQTTSASTLENGDMEITATIDGKVKVVSEASIRRHLKLEDSDGISTLPTSEIFKQLALIGKRISNKRTKNKAKNDKTEHKMEERGKAKCMRTRSQSRNQNRHQQQAPPVVVKPFNLEEPVDNPPVVNMAANGAGGAGPPLAGGGGLPVPDLRTMEELCQPSLDGRGGPIALIAIQATTFGLKNDMI